MQVISCDGHVVEPLEALPRGATYQGLTKQLLVLPAGYTQVPLPVWTSVGNGTVGMGAGFKQPLGLDDRPEAWDAGARAAYCAMQGVAAEVLYPTFAMLAVETAGDDEYAMHAAGQYNDWVLANFKPPLFHPLLIQPVLSLESLVYLLQDAVDDFPTGILLPQQPRSGRWRDYIPAFAVAAEAGCPIHWHAFTRPTAESFAVDPLAQAWAGVRAAQDILLELILGGVFKEVPTLKVVFAEFDVGWVGHFRLRLQRLVEKYGPALALGVTVTDIARWFAENIYFAVQDIMEVLHQAPQAQALWGWDFPHSDAVPVPQHEGVLHTALVIEELDRRAVQVYPRLAAVPEGEG